MVQYCDCQDIISYLCAVLLSSRNLSSRFGSLQRHLFSRFPRDVFASLPTAVRPVDPHFIGLWHDFCFGFKQRLANFVIFIDESGSFHKLKTKQIIIWIITITTLPLLPITGMRQV